MISTDEDALACDLAETYHIYDYRSLPVHTAATLASGLRNESRIRMEMAGVKYTLSEMLLTTIYDKLNLLCWAQSKDGAKGINRPELLSAELFGAEKASNVKAFSSADEFEKERQRIIGGEKRWQQN